MLREILLYLEALWAGGLLFFGGGPGGQIGPAGTRPRKQIANKRTDRRVASLLAMTALKPCHSEEGRRPDVGIRDLRPSALAFLKGQVPLQDQRGRHGVHHLFPLPGVLPALVEDVVGVDGGAPLVPEHDRQPRGLLQQALHGLGLLRPGPQCAVHVHGMAQHQLLRPVFFRQLRHPLGHRLRPVGGDDGGEARKEPCGIRNGDARVGVAIVNGHDTHRNSFPLPRACDRDAGERLPPRFPLSYHAAARFGKENPRFAGKISAFPEKISGFFPEKPLTRRLTCDKISLTCEKGLSYHAYFRFSGGKRGALRTQGGKRRPPAGAGQDANSKRRCR